MKQVNRTKSTVAEVNIQQSGAILIKRKNRGVKTYWPTNASYNRVCETLCNNGNSFMQNRWHFFRV